jgi:hypothetical protein
MNFFYGIWNNLGIVVFAAVLVGVFVFLSCDITPKIKEVSKVINLAK